MTKLVKSNIFKFIVTIFDLDPVIVYAKDFEEALRMGIKIKGCAHLIVDTWNVEIVRPPIFYTDHYRI